MTEPQATASPAATSPAAGFRPPTPQKLAGARRVLATAQRNHAWAMTADVPTWMRVATAGRVAAAQDRLAQLGVTP